ncbi:MAG: hypothetical protein FJ264_10745 [Planctomycetes bacterium]|nr:hypothetical protein [Planctomycetota bacterium]
MRSVEQKKAGLPGGEGMQMVQMIQYAPSNPNIVYAVVDTSQVWKSEDSGYSWNSARNGFHALGGFSLGIDPKNENVVFVSGAVPGGGSPVDGIYRTLDGGKSWKLTKQTYYSKSISNDPNDAGEGQHYAFDPGSFDGEKHTIIYAGTHTEGLLKSTDGGDTWQTVGLKGLRILDIELVSINTSINVLYVATNNTKVTGNGLYKVTENNKNTYTIAPLGNLPDFPRTIAVAVQNNSPIVYATIGNHGIYKSVDGGNTFVCKWSGFSSGKECRTISVIPKDPDYLYLKLGRGAENILNPLYSNDGGETWNTPKNLNVGKLDIQWIGPGPGISIAPHPYELNIALGSMLSSIRKTTNGGKTWKYSGNGFMGARCAFKTSSYFDPENPERKIFFLIDFGPVVTEDGGNSWKKLKIKGRTASVGTVDNSQNTMLVASGRWTSQIILRSENNGNSWETVNNTNDHFIFMKFHPQDSNYVYTGTKSGSWISNDNGKSWTFIANKSIRVVYPKNGDIVYAFEETTHDNSILWYSNNRGLTWKCPVPKKRNPFKNVLDVDIDPNNPNRLYVAANDGFYIFDGKDWKETTKSGGIPPETYGNIVSRKVSAVAVDPFNPNRIYIGKRDGNLGHPKNYIFCSDDYGLTWKDIKYNLPGYSSIFSLAIEPTTGDLYACTAHGNYYISFYH